MLHLRSDSRCAARGLFPAVCFLAACTAAQALFPTTVSGQTHLADSRQAVDTVLDRHPDLAAAGIGADALRAHASFLGALPDPKIDVTWFPYRVFTARGSQRTRVSVEQSIPWPGIRAARSRAARSNAERLDQDAMRLALDLARETRSAWNRAWRANALVLNAHTFEESLRRFEASATNRYETGEEAMAPLISIQLERAALDVTVSLLSEDLLAARRELARLADAPDLFLPDSLPPVFRISDIVLPGVQDVSGRTGAALASRPELHALQALRKSRLEEIDVARRSAMPDFLVGLNWVDTAEESFLPNGDGRDALGLRFGLKVPLWGAARRAPQERARLGLAEVDALIRARQTQIRTEVEELSARLLVQREQLRQLRDELVPRAEIARSTALTAYRSGQTSLLQVLDAERTLNALRIQHIDTISRLTETHILLERALGARPATSEE